MFKLFFAQNKIIYNNNWTVYFGEIFLYCSYTIYKKGE